MDIIVILLIIFILATGILASMLVIKNKQIMYYQIVSKNLSAMRVIQSMFEILGANISGSNKIEEINKVILDTYKPKYSSIVIFDGENYNVQATNIDNEYVEAISKIANENEFKTNILKNVSKYITTSADKTLIYKSAIERNVKSCMFTPIYHGTTYIGYWILEDDIINAFDSMSKSELAKLKNNMGVFLENTLYQNIIETAENTDKQTGFYNNLYLYSKARNKLLEFENTSATIIDFSNLSNINIEYSREIGNELLEKSVMIIKELTGSNSICVRYSGARMLILLPNSTAQSVHSSMERMLSRIKNEAIKQVDGKYIALEIKMLIKTLKKQNNIDKEVQSLVAYIENMKEVDTIKII